MSDDMEPRRGLYPADEPLQFEVVAVERRRAFGRIDVLLLPVKGTGRRWVSSESVDWSDKEESDG